MWEGRVGGGWCMACIVLALIDCIDCMEQR